MTNQMSGQIKYGGWGIALGAVIAMVVGFMWGGWVTGGTASKMSDTAILASRSAICVAQFTSAPNYAQTLLAYQKSDSWNRGTFIGKGGWDRMPGQKEADGSVADECAKGIDALPAKK